MFSAEAGGSAGTQGRGQACLHTGTFQIYKFKDAFLNQ